MVPLKSWHSNDAAPWFHAVEPIGAGRPRGQDPDLGEEIAPGQDVKERHLAKTKAKVPGVPGVPKNPGQGFVQNQLLVPSGQHTKSYWKWP